MSCLFLSFGDKVLHWKSLCSYADLELGSSHLNFWRAGDYKCTLWPSSCLSLFLFLNHVSLDLPSALQLLAISLLLPPLL